MNKESLYELCSICLWILAYILQHKHIHLSMDVPIGMWLLGGAYE